MQGSIIAMCYTIRLCLGCCRDHPILVQTVYRKGSEGVIHNCNYVFRTKEEWQTKWVDTSIASLKQFYRRLLGGIPFLDEDGCSPVQ